jgi:hypothetical protein
MNVQSNLYVQGTQGNLKMYPFHKQLPFTYRLNLYALFITVMGEMRLSFIDSDFLYRGDL